MTFVARLSTACRSTCFPCCSPVSAEAWTHGIQRRDRFYDSPWIEESRAWIASRPAQGSHPITSYRSAPARSNHNNQGAPDRQNHAAAQNVSFMCLIFSFGIFFPASKYHGFSCLGMSGPKHSCVPMFTTVFARNPAMPQHVLQKFLM